MSKKEKILQWLKEHDVIEQLYGNFKENSFRKSIPIDIELIQNAFDFESAPEGSAYWWKKHNQYKKWYREEFPKEVITVDDVREFMEQKK